jgi:MFS family permease
LILAVFRVRSFRFQVPADLLTSWAFEMETIILGWYVLVHTGSVLLLTAFASLQFLGTLAAPMFGVLGDRLGARVLLCVMRATYAVLAALMMLLAFTGILTPAWVFALAALAGFFRPNDLVMRNSLVGETIPPSHLMGALGMSRAIMDSARVAGALAGAGLSSVLGIGSTYVFVTGFYLASLALTFGVSRRRPVADPTVPSPSPLWGEGRVRGPKVRGPKVRGPKVRGERGRPRSRWRDLRDGLVHIVTTPALLALMWLAFLINLTAYPVSSGLLPYVAKQVFLVDAAGLGWLVASFSFGGLLASVTMVVTGGPRRPERSTLVYTAIWYALLLGFAHARGIGGGMLLLFAAGFVQNVAMISMAATLLAVADERFRGRVMGVRTLAVYGMPLGLMASGVLIERIGYPLTISLCAAIGLLFTLLIGMKWRASMWRPQAATGRTSPAVGR